MAARRGTYQLREHWIGIVEHGPATERLCRSAIRPFQPVMQYSDWPSTANAVARVQIGVADRSQNLDQNLVRAWRGNWHFLDAQGFPNFRSDRP